MNIIILEHIFKYLKKFHALYCCILLPEFLEIKNNIKIFLDTEYIANKNFEKYILGFKFFKNINFEIRMKSHKYLKYKLNNLKNINLTLDLHDFDLNIKKDENVNFCRELELPLSNISGINNIEIDIPSYYKLKNNFLSISDINTVSITTNSPIEKIYLTNVKKLILNDSYKLKELTFDSNMRSLSLFRSNSSFLNNLKSDTLDELSINACTFNKNFKISQNFPKLKYLQLDFSTFDNNFNIENLYGNYNFLSLNYVQKNINDFSNFKNLKNLQFIGNNMIESINGFCGKNLILDQCERLNKFNFQNLETLYLSGNFNLKSKDTENFKNIKALDLSNTNIEYLSDKITNLQIFLGRNCLKLKSFPKYDKLSILNLSNCVSLEYINTTTISNLNVYNCKKLKNLKELKVLNLEV
jgi:hypothetical protein